MNNVRPIKTTDDRSGRCSYVNADAVLADAFVHRLTILVYLYPLFWVVGLGATFFFVTAILSAMYLVRVRICAESWVVLGIVCCIILSIPIGLSTFGFNPWRAASVFGNIAVWVTLAGAISAGMLANVRPRLSYALITVAAIQGAATLVAVALYPQRLPVPLLWEQMASMPTGFRQFAARSLAYDGWLDGFSIRSSGIMAQPTWAGAFAALAAILALFELSRKRHQIFLSCSIFLCGVSMYYSLSRTTYFVVFAATAVGVMFALRRRDRREFAIVVTILAPLTAALLISRWEYISEMIARINGARKGSLEVRMDIYVQTWEFMRELGLPLVGFGIKPQLAGFWASIASHSTYLGLAFRGGIIALLFLIVFLVQLVRRVLRDHNALGAAILVVIAIWMIIGDIDVGHMLPLFLIFCVASPSAAHGLDQNCDEGEDASATRRPSDGSKVLGVTLGRADTALSSG